MFDSVLKLKYYCLEYVITFEPKLMNFKNPIDFNLRWSYIFYNIETKSGRPGSKNEYSN